MSDHLDRGTHSMSAHEARVAANARLSAQWMAEAEAERDEEAA
jgi:hypothetical protein